MLNKIYLYLILSLLLLPVVGFSQLNNSKTISIKPGSSIGLKANGPINASYQWFKNSQPIINGVNQILRVNTEGKYTVISIEKDKCASDMSDIIEVIIGIGGEIYTNLKINKEVENKAVSVNDDFTYTISVLNQGPDDAVNITVTDTLPPQIAFKSFINIANIKTNYNTQKHIATWQIPNLKKDSTINLQLTTKALEPGNTINIATVYASPEDLVEEDNIAYAEKYIYGIKIPNVITPNGDGANDFLEIAGLENYPDNEITILNRWGNHVYEKKGYLNTWDAKGLNEGTYYYVLKIKTIENKWQVFKGFVLVIKSKK